MMFRNDAGFTLFEILIAMFIFTIFMTVVVGSFHIMFATANVIEDSMSSFEMAKSCLDRMSEDLRSIYVSTKPFYRKPEGVQTSIEKEKRTSRLYRFTGDATFLGGASYSKLRFTSFAHLPFGEEKMKDGIVEIIYYVQQNENDDMVLKRADNIYSYRDEDEVFVENRLDPVLCENVKSLSFVYYDDEDTEHEYWDSEDSEFNYATPKAVKIILEIGDENKSVKFESMVDLPVYREPED